MKFLLGIWNWIESLFSKNLIEPKPTPIDSEPETKPSKEDYYNNKYPKAIIYYTGRTLPVFGSYKLDVRNFFTNESDEIQQISNQILKTVSEKTDDVIALACQKWICNNIKYVSDKTQFDLAEFWMFPFETLKTRLGDCDDGAILLANLLLAFGIPYWKVRINAGDVYDEIGRELGGHAYVTYYCEEKDRWVALDWCFYPDSDILVENKPDYKDSIFYGKGTVWFSWNKKYSFFKPATNMILTKSKKYKGIKSNFYIKQ